MLKFGPILPQAGTDLWKNDMYSHGLYWWPASYKDADGFDQKAVWNVRKASAHDPQLAELWKDHGPLTSDRDKILTAACWADCGFPVVQLDSAKYAAALMATRPPSEGELNLPWKAFCVEVPEGLLAINGWEVRLIWVHRWDSVEESSLTVANEAGGDEALLVPATWAWRLFFCPAKKLGRSNDYMVRCRSLEALRREDLEEHLPTEDMRAVQLATRLVLNLCIAMSDPSAVRREGPKMAGWVRGPAPIPRAAKQPVTRTYVVGRPIKLDCREALKEYVEGRRSSSPTVQFLVRGHWRNQACGPRLTERKMTWIEPYWKGPEDAPINVRPHVVR